MFVGDVLRRAGAASPLIPPLVYTATLTAATLAISLAPGSVPTAAIGLVAWLLASAFLAIVVTWYRDDDWLAAGFLIGMGVVVGGLVAQVVTSIVVTRSIGEAVFVGAGAALSILVRAVVLVPLCGGLVALARWVTRRARRRRTRPDAPAA